MKQFLRSILVRITNRYEFTNRLFVDSQLSRCMGTTLFVILCLFYSNAEAQPPVLNLNEELNSSAYSIHPNYTAIEAIHAQPGTHAVATTNTDQIHLYISSSNRMANTNPAHNDSTGKDAAIKYGIGVYPNPASDNINVTISALTNGQTAIVCLFDDQGRSLLIKQQTTGNEMIEFSKLNSGIYLLRIMINSEQVSYRIVKI